MILTIEDLKRIKEWHEKQIIYLDSIIKRDTITQKEEEEDSEQKHME
jgi:hypothetical protein